MKTFQVLCLDGGARDEIMVLYITYDIRTDEYEDLDVIDVMIHVKSVVSFTFYVRCPRCTCSSPESYTIFATSFQSCHLTTSGLMSAYMW